MRDGPALVMAYIRDVLLRAGRSVVIPKPAYWLPHLERGASHTKH